MPTSAKILIVEDQPEWSQFLVERYRIYMREIVGLDEVRIEEASTGREALAKVTDREAMLRPYDFISLDINLGASEADDESVDGIRILETIGKRGASWMVAILTGAESDPSLDANLTEKRANYIRKNLRSKAMASFPPERLMVVEKPKELSSLSGGDLVAGLAGSETLENRLRQMVQVFNFTTTYRNVWRKMDPVEVIKKSGTREDMTEEEVILSKKPGNAWMARPKITKSRWQIRYDCGELVTIDGVEGYHIIAALLENERKEFSPGELLAIAEGESPARENLFEKLLTHDVSNSTEDASKREGVCLNDDGDEDSPNDDDANIEAENFSTAKELLTQGGGSIQSESWDDTDVESTRSYRADLARRKSRIAELASHSKLLTTSEQRELIQLKKDVAALEPLAKGGAQGADSKEAGDIRTAKKRVLDDLRAEGFFELAEHIDYCLDSRNGKWSYWPHLDMNWQV